MDPNQTVAAAMHAAVIQNLYPNTAAAAPLITNGPTATTVLMMDHNDQWIVCVHLNGKEPGEWYVTGELAPLAAAASAATYALRGLPSASFPGARHGREE